jgi:hypothetical protein
MPMQKRIKNEIEKISLMDNIKIIYNNYDSENNYHETIMKHDGNKFHFLFTIDYPFVPPIIYVNDILILCNIIPKINNDDEDIIFSSDQNKQYINNIVENNSFIKFMMMNEPYKIKNRNGIDIPFIKNKIIGKFLRYYECFWEHWPPLMNIMNILNILKNIKIIKLRDLLSIPFNNEDLILINMGYLNDISPKNHFICDELLNDIYELNVKNISLILIEPREHIFNNIEYFNNLCDSFLRKGKKLTIYVSKIFPLVDCEASTQIYKYAYFSKEQTKNINYKNIAFEEFNSFMEFIDLNKKKTIIFDSIIFYDNDMCTCIKNLNSIAQINNIPYFKYDTDLKNKNLFFYPNCEEISRAQNKFSYYQIRDFIFAPFLKLRHQIDIQKGGYTKYMKYITKNKMYKMKGGMNIIEHGNDDMKFLEGWEKIPNYGQRNCGIYISPIYHPKKIMKCESDNLEKVIYSNTVNTTIGDIFPQIYEIHKIKDYYFIIMEKFDGDLTKLIYELSVDNVITKLKISDSDKIQIKFIYDNLMPKTLNNSKLQGANVLTEFVDIFKDSKKNKEFIEAINKQLIGQEELLLKNIEFDDKIYNQYDCDNFKKLNLIKSTFINFDINIRTYLDFIYELEYEIKKLLNIVRDQIYYIHLLLYKNGFRYWDTKFDNFAYKLEDDNKEHLGKIWTNNLYNGKYIFVYVIDPSSGLSKTDAEIVEKIAKDNVVEYNNYYLNYTKYGQYYGYELGHPLIKSRNVGSYQSCGYQYNFLGINDDVFRIINGYYKLEIKKDNFTHDEIINRIEKS